MKIAGSILILAASAIYAVAQDGMFIQDVSWSSDGKYLAFTGMHDINRQANTLKADIYVIRADGSDLRKISSDETNEFYTSWSRGRVVFSSGSQGTKMSDIYSVNADGSDLRQLTRGPGRNTSPSASRNGRKIAFASTREGEKYQIYVMNADGSAVTRLTMDGSVGYYNPQFSPDGKRVIYYVEKGDGLDQVWVMNIDGSNQTLLTAGIGHNIFPGWSADGKRVIFSSSKREKNDSGSYIDGGFLYAMSADGSGLMKVGNVKSFFGRFSPDGKKIAYVSGEFPTSSIFIANADGSGAKRITK